MISEKQAESLLEELVAIPSLSGQESQASAWLVEEMKCLGYDQAYVDEAGNAVGILGAAEAENSIVLLGHIDTVPGHIKVERKQTKEGINLFGRGTVDAKGPLANFVLSGINAKEFLPAGTRLSVVGAVEEESATSKGARAIRDRMDGISEAIPLYCVIGEPSGAYTINRGYRGRVIISFTAQQPTAHTAGPGREIAELAALYWQWLENQLSLVNREKGRLFDQASPSLRDFNTDAWDGDHNRVNCTVGIRLPLGFNLEALVQASTGWLKEQVGIVSALSELSPEPDRPQVYSFGDSTLNGQVSFSGVEPAWLTPKRNHLCRSLQGAIRQETGKKARYSVKTGTCDMNVVGPAWRCPMVAYGPGDSLLDHTPEEHISLAEFHSSTRVLTQALHNLYATL